MMLAPVELASLKVELSRGKQEKTVSRIHASPIATLVATDLSARSLRDQSNMG
jgi:hypothetical protein